MDLNLEAQRDTWIACGELANATYAYNTNPSKLLLDESFEEDLVDKQMPRGFLRVASIFTQSDKTEGGEAFAGFVACNTSEQDALYFSWRGTVFKKEWEADGNVDKIEMRQLTNTIQPDTADQYEEALKYGGHQGMCALYDTAKYRLAPGFSAGDGPVSCLHRPALSMRELLHKVLDTLTGIKKVHITGHSLGGALATMNAYHLVKLLEKEEAVLPAKDQLPFGPDAVYVVTFSAPRVAGLNLAHVLNEKVKNKVRIQIDGDMVPQVPLYGGDEDMNKLGGDESDEGLLGWALWLGRRATDTIIGNVDILPKGLGPGGHFSFAELGEIVIPYFFKTVQSLLFDKQARFHHAGLGINLPSTSLPRDIYNEVPWGLGMHHSLLLILYLLEIKGDGKGPNRFDEGLRAEIGKAQMQAHVSEDQGKSIDLASHAVPTSERVLDQEPPATPELGSSN